MEPFYWPITLLPSLPVMRGGASSAASNADLDFPGIIKKSEGGIVSIPTPMQSTIRISYFRTQGRGDETLPENLTLLGTPFYQGNWLATTHLMQDAKVSWDFLTYPLPAGPRKIRVKTLWEVQWVSFSTQINAPYATVATVNGSAVSNYASEGKNLIRPTFGGELEQAPFRHFRYELKASGFGIPHHGDIWDMEGSLAFRFGKLELLVGAKAFHFETNPQLDEYFTDTIKGPYVGLRYYLRNPE